MSRRSVPPAPRGKPSGLPFQAKFTDVAAAAGLRAPVIYGDAVRKNYLTETIGCGVAFLDYDRDGWLDIFVLGGSRLEGAPADSTNRLYKNNRDGTFTDVTDKAGLRKTGWASSVAVGDFNNDGFDDLFVTYWGQNVLYRNNGDGTFTDVTAKARLATAAASAPPVWGSGCTFVDYDRNGLLDLLVAHYVDFDLNAVPKLGEAAACNWKGVPVPCGPRGLPPGGLKLYRNNGDETFTDVTAASGLIKAKGSYPLTAVAADFDNDGWPDLYVACDSTASFLLRNNHDGTFTDIGLESGVALNGDGMEQAGMGLAIGDYNLDGNLDIFKTHFCDDTCVLYRNNGKWNFDDVTVTSGLGVETRYTCWGTAMLDLDNDGLPDLFFATGSIYPELEAKVPAYPYQTPRVIFRNLGGGKFEELMDGAGPGVAAAHSSRGCAFGDFDNDGDVDVVIVNFNEPPSLLRNDVTGGGHWLKVKLEGTKSNRSAIGATVVAKYGGKKQAQAVLSQGSFFSVNDLRLHFGLGSEKTADLEIRWPSGAVEQIAAVDGDQLVTVREGSGVV
ncbi:MAG TPA: CRTAC1 family protein, partial [Bryobacteraceae bacterium]|nr:CRTAC1 family protein [Bryobacteraceae bacterium]